jgi:hypothetical protein
VEILIRKIFKQEFLIFKAQSNMTCSGHPRHPKKIQSLDFDLAPYNQAMQKHVPTGAPDAFLCLPSASEFQMVLVRSSLPSCHASPPHAQPHIRLTTTMAAFSLSSLSHHTSTYGVEPSLRRCLFTPTASSFSPAA